MATYISLGEVERAQMNAGLPPDEWVFGYWAETPLERDRRVQHEAWEDANRREAQRAQDVARWRATHR